MTSNGILGVYRPGSLVDTYGWRLVGFASCPCIVLRALRVQLSVCQSPCGRRVVVVRAATECMHSAEEMQRCRNCGWCLFHHFGSVLYTENR